MKKFLKNISLFTLFALVVVVGLVMITRLVCRYTFDFRVSEEKNILVVGNSHPACAINDKVFTRSYNLSQGGTEYFYNYVKAREVLKRNQHIDTLVVGYWSIDIGKGRDGWFSSSSSIMYMIRNYFFMFGWDDYSELLSANPVGTLTHTPQLILHNLKNVLKGYSVMGGYSKLTRSNLEDAKEELLKKGDHEQEVLLSDIQQKYLLKIYHYCQANDIQLILLNTPIDPAIDAYHENYKNAHCAFIQQMPDAIFVNHTNFELSGEDYADLDHLNFQGAQKYSEFLAKGGLTKSLGPCGSY